MQASIRKIGNSRGLIIPASILNQLQIQDKVEMDLIDNQLIIRPIQTEIRKNWFKNYDASLDTEPLKEMVDLKSEQEDWEW